MTSPLGMPHMLLVMQTDDADAGRCSRLLQKRGYLLDYCYPMAGQPLPIELNGYAGVMVFGGPMSANDDGQLSGIRAQLDWMPQVLQSEHPFLCICLGAQLLARALGSSVKPHPDGRVEIGYFEIKPIAAVEQNIFDKPLHVYQWHQEGFDLPEGAELLASGEHFPHQAYRYGTHAFGVQFHPEVERPIMETWLRAGARELDKFGAQSAVEQRENHARYDVLMERWFDRFLDDWCSG